MLPISPIIESNDLKLIKIERKTKRENFVFFVKKRFLNKKIERNKEKKIFLFRKNQFATSLRSHIHERLVNCSTPLNSTLHASPLLNICENDTYTATGSRSSKRPSKKPNNDLKKAERKIRHAIHLSEYRSIDLMVRF